MGLVTPKAPFVFIAEDDPLIRELVLTRLSLAGYTTGWASDGSTALACCKERRPDALILDIEMPALDGLDVLRRLVRHYIDRPIPTLMLTARNSTDDVRRAISFGAMDFMRKPFDDKILLARVARLLRRRTAA